jgi:hypothetical protein
MRTEMSRRNRLRFETDLSVNVTPLGRPGAASKGRLKNLSAQGVAVIMKTNLPLHSRALLGWGGSTFEGRVVYCQPWEVEFLIGFRIDGHVYDGRERTTQKASNP